ncbi:periplasmic chaperone for outer membrane proteins Skp [Lutibacter sp. Hel_I_33_5]|uniref:OmpH family outer membrane protein n=1 Tax=Lutibacter sp. Hel_I_33_5 TaxID=1566289 RepID=UPI0011A41C63|nr:OmpH family outer membrane protein [Lutibacter sp. Hel_I_33_5]TVZ55097.1 periplasmic chaperone for outer membrane proteins Skp [Lutibacter sp. Hel_I_33_5]
MKSKLLIAITILFTSISFAQTKVGTVDLDYIIGLMPEMKKVISNTQAYGVKLDSTFQVKLKEYQVKLEEYKKMSDLLKKVNTKEIAGLEQDLQKYRQNGNQLIQLKRDEFMRPLYGKVGGVISEISKANGYTQVLTIKGNEFAYIDEKFDITQLVLDKLGLKPAAKKN